MTPLTVSVALATYNGACFLAEQLDSLARQTRKPDELVVCDDASSDASLDIVRAFAERAAFPVRILRNDANFGYVLAFERAISQCGGDVIFLCDQDDVWVDQKIEMMLGPFADPAVGAVFSDALVVDRELRSRGFTVWDFSLFRSERRQRFENGQAFFELFKANAVQGASLAFRASLRPLVLPLSSHWPHDHWVVLQIAVLAKLHPVDACLTLYRQHGANAIGASSAVRSFPVHKLRMEINRLMTRTFARRRYYEEKQKRAQHDLQRFLSLRNRLCDIAANRAAHYTRVVDEQIARTRRSLARYETKLR